MEDKERMLSDKNKEIMDLKFQSSSFDMPQNRDSEVSNLQFELNNLRRRCDGLEEDLRINEKTISEKNK